jgi:hypothetical protein
VIAYVIRVLERVCLAEVAAKYRPMLIFWSMKRVVVEVVMVSLIAE